MKSVMLYKKLQSKNAGWRPAKKALIDLVAAENFYYL